jgi:hypothetical protein
VLWDISALVGCNRNNTSISFYQSKTSHNIFYRIPFLVCIVYPEVSCAAVRAKLVNMAITVIYARNLSMLIHTQTSLPPSLPPITPAPQHRLIKTKYILTEFTFWTQTFNLHCLKFHSGWSLDSVGLWTCTAECTASI